jgi:hypothetical protein
MHKATLPSVLLGTSLLLIIGCSVPQSGIPSAPTTLKNATPDPSSDPGHGAHRVDEARVDVRQADRPSASPGAAAVQVPPSGPTTFAVQTVVIVISTAPDFGPSSPSDLEPTTTTVTPTPVPSNTAPTTSPDPRTTEPIPEPDSVPTSTSPLLESVHGSTALPGV